MWAADARTVVVADDGTKMVQVPRGALRVVLAAVQDSMKARELLEEELAHVEEEATTLELTLHKRREQLERFASLRPEVVRPSQPRVSSDTDSGHREGKTDPRAMYRQRSRSALFSSSGRDLVDEVEDEMNQLMAREKSLRALMGVTQDLSKQSTLADVVGSALRAAQSVISAEKYTLAILSEKKDTMELFSNPPVALPGRSYVEEGSMVVDSNTTFGRVVLTGRPLEVDEVDDFEMMDMFEEQLDLLGFEPQALICAPIFNVHGIMVGVFQVITRKRLIVPLMRSPTNTVNMNDQFTPTQSKFPKQEKENFHYVCVIAGKAIWNVTLVKAHQVAQSRIECLLKLNRNISVEINSSMVLDQVISVSYELLNAEKIQLYVRSEGSDEFYAVHGVLANSSDEDLAEHNGITGYVMRTGQLVLTNNAQEHPEFNPGLDEKTSFHTRQVLCAPVKDAESNILAVVCASNKADGGEFTPEDALYLNYAADAAGTSLHKSNLLREVIISQCITEARLKLTDFVASSTSIAEFVNLVTHEGKKLMSCDRFGFLLVDQLKKELWLTQIDGKNIRIPINKGISGLVAMTGEPICTRDAYTHSWFDPTVDQKTGYRTTSVLGMPIFEDHTPRNPKIVAVALSINKKDGNRVVPFSASDRINMTRYCQEIQDALGRLSLDISYYKVVSDCAMNASHASLSSESVAESDSKRTAKSEDDVLEGEIITSIVQKYCQSNEYEGLAIAEAAPSQPPGATGEDPASPIRHENQVVIQDYGSIIGIGNIDRWDFNALDLSNPDIFVVTTAIFRVFGVFDKFHISNEKFSTFLSHVASHYRPNPFHNLQHGFHVMHVTYTMIRREFTTYFTILDIFAMLIASLCHDIDHPGNNNDFEVKSLSQIALTHNDDAVLERHHCRVTFIILSHASGNILEHLPRESFLSARRVIIHCILATDMSKHFDKCKLLEGYTRKHFLEKKYVVMGILVHAADLSGQALPYDQAIRWGMRVLTEFQNQAKSEEEMKVPVESFMTNLHQMKARVSVQMNFINYVLRPIWRPLGALCPQLRMFSDSLEANFEFYKADLAKLLNENQQEQRPVVYVRGESSRLLHRRMKEAAKESTNTEIRRGDAASVQR